MKWTEKITRFAIKNRKSPAKNRRIVGKYLSFVAVALFGLFLANFAYIIAKGNIFGTDVELSMTEMECLSQKMRPLIMSMLLLTKNTSQQREKFFM